MSEAAFERAIPRGNWALSCAMAFLVTAIVAGLWEVRVRAMGYPPSVNETSDLWASVRNRLEKPGVEAVVVGSSRAQFDLDLRTYAEFFGTSEPIQLAMPGTNPMQLLESVVAAESFRGTVILGVTPALWFVPEGMPVDQARQAVGRFQNWSPSQRASFWLGVPLQERLAYWNPEDLSLDALIARLPLANRPAAEANQPPLLPPFFAVVDRLRQARMWEQCVFGSPLAQEIQRRWVPLFTPPPPPPGVSPEEFRERFGEFVEGNLQRLKGNVDALRARGCRVVFVRFPSAGRLREMERKFSPRAGFYDRMLAVTGAPGIHFEDHPELSAFDCPEWSHLTAEDAVRFSVALMPLLAEVLDEEPAGTH